PQPQTMNRRAFLFSAAAGAAAAAATAPRTSMGVATTSYLTVARPKDMLAFMDHCHELGAGGVQASLTSLEPDYVAKERGRAKQYGMYIELMSGLPREGDQNFERTLAAAKQVGALCVRAACLGGRRYETFNDMAAWQRFVADSRAAIDRALPILDKYGVPL